MTLTPDEVLLVQAIARERSSGERLGFYAAVLFAPLAMAIYGLAQRDVFAISIAFFGMFLLVLWSIVREAKYAKPFRAVCRKWIASGFAPGPQP